MLPDILCLSHGMCLYKVMMTLYSLNDVANGMNDAESTQKSIIASNWLVLRVNQLGKLINRIPGLRLLI